MPKNAVVIVAAGRGSRMGNEVGPKQYILLDDVSILQHTIAGFTSHQNIDLVQVVIHADDSALYNDAVMPHNKLLEPVFGGSTRQESCKAGLDALPSDVEKILIHDAARPFVSHSVITNVLDGIAQNFCALPAVTIVDTVKRAEPNGVISETVNRDGLYMAQTPQGFVLSDISAAHEKAESQNETDFTDDAAVAEWAGMTVRIVAGDQENFKITTLGDLVRAKGKMTMANRMPDIRTGSGYDVHTLGPGREVILCGHKVPHTQALQGHSDADVGLHSLTDALLGTIGAGDIGDHFPPTDPKWKGAASDQFLAHAVALVKAHGGTITNLDVTIICESPKIGPHRYNMRQRVSEICGLDDLTRVSVKATTNEKIGFIGREEGIAALATATVSFGKVI